MAIEFDHDNKLINITSPQDTLSCQDLINAIRTEEASERGINYPQIATASGKESLGEGVYVGMTVNLISPWQVKFWEGNYIAKISGGNLVGGILGDPVAYSAGVQILLVQSAASTVVVTSDGLNAAESALLQTAATESTKARKMQTNKAIISGDGRTVSIYDDDGMTLLHVFDISADKKTRDPQ
ncbi:MAG: hypothetical protein KAT62_00825 [Desulfuromonadales bacterium]|nr:hypothetical protein [Desulfuromonadales bacterium]